MCLIICSELYVYFRNGCNKNMFFLLFLFYICVFNGEYNKVKLELV